MRKETEETDMFLGLVRTGEPDFFLLPCVRTATRDVERFVVVTSLPAMSEVPVGLEDRSTNTRHPRTTHPAHTTRHKSLRFALTAGVKM